MQVLNINDYIECDLTIAMIVSAFERRCPTQWTLQEKSGRPYHGFVYILSGNAVFKTDEGILEVSAGDFLFLSKGSRYITRNVSDTPYNFIVVSFLLTESDTHPFLQWEKIMNSTGYCYKDVMNMLVNTWFYKGIGYKVKCKSILQDILFHAILDSIHSNMNTKNLHKIKPSVEYMERFYDRQMTVEGLACLSRLSSTHFRRLFKEVYKVSPLQYLISIRINKAKDLLLTDMYSIGEISEMTGFSDISYFSRIFKKYVGTPPTSFKAGEDYTL